MALMACSECGKQISDRAVTCPSCGVPISGIAPATEKVQPSTPRAKAHYSNYKSVPWYRRSNVNTAFILIGFGSKGFIPLTLVTCILLLTGNVYYKDTDNAGQLRIWSKANKIAAVAILFANIAYLVYIAIN